MNKHLRNGLFCLGGGIILALFGAYTAFWLSGFTILLYVLLFFLTCFIFFIYLISWVSSGKREYLNVGLILMLVPIFLFAGSFGRRQIHYQRMITNLDFVRTSLEGEFRYTDEIEEFLAKNYITNLKADRFETIYFYYSEEWGPMEYVKAAGEWKRGSTW